MSPRALALALSLALPMAALAEDGLPIVIRCEACDASVRPAVTLSWIGEDGARLSSTIEAADWAAGKFVGRTNLGIPGLDVTSSYTATYVDASTWQLDGPVVEHGGMRPFRAVITLPGYTATHAVAFPSRDPGPISFELTPVEQVLDDHPTWDPRHSRECEVLIPKSSAAPVTFYADGMPCAWLYLQQGHDPLAEGAWVFQFVKPGASLLERMSVPVTGFDEGDALAFRLPLEALAAEPVIGREKSVAPPRSLRVGEALMIALDDCPREAR